MKKIIIALLLIVVGLLVYIGFLKKDTVTPAVTVQTSVPSNQDKKVVSTQTQSASQEPKNNTVTKGSYTNTQYHFSILLDDGLKVTTTQQNATGMSSVVTGSSVHTPHLRNISVTGPSCQGPSLLTIQGMNFVRETSSGNYGGMETGSFDAAYCVIHGDFAYIFGFTHTYPRVGPNTVVPNQTADLQSFEKELESLHLVFTS